VQVDRKGVVKVDVPWSSAAIVNLECWKSFSSNQIEPTCKK